MPNAELEISQDRARPLHSIIIYFYAGLIFFVPFAIGDEKWHDFVDLGQSIYIQIISCVMLCIWLLECVITKHFSVVKSKFYLPGASILVWSYFSLIWSTNILMSLAVLMQWTAYAIIFFVMVNTIKSSKDSSVFFTAIFASYVSIVVIGYIQYFNSDFKYYPQSIAPAGTFANKNMLSDYLVIVGPFGLYFFLNSSSSLIIRILSSIALISVTSLIILTKTRSGILSICILGALYLITLFWMFKVRSGAKELFSRQIKLSSFGLLLMICFVLFSILKFGEKDGTSVLGNRIKSIFVRPEMDRAAIENNSMGKKLHAVSDSSTIRLIVWSNTVHMILNKPLVGVGLNNWQVNYGEYRKSFIEDPGYSPKNLYTHVHNGYLQILADLGIFGFFLFVWFAFVFIKISWQSLNSANVEHSNKLKIFSIMFSFIGFCLVSFFGIVLMKPSPPLFLLIGAAMLESLSISCVIMNSGSGDNLFRLNRKYAKMAIIPFAILTIVVARFELSRGDSDKLFKSAEISFKNKDWVQAVEKCEKLINSNPLEFEAYQLLGSAYFSNHRLLDARKSFEKSLFYRPNDLFSLHQLCSVLVLMLQEEIRKKEPQQELLINLEKDALKCFNHSNSIRNDFESIWCNLGFVYEKQYHRLIKSNMSDEATEALKSAESSYDRALELNPKYTEAVINKASLFLQSDRESAGNSLLFDVLKVFTDNIEKDLKKVVFDMNKGLGFNATLIYENKIKVTNDSIEYLKKAPRIIDNLKRNLIKRNDYKGYLKVIDFEINFKRLQKIIKLESLVNFNNSQILNKSGEISKEQIKANLERILTNNKSAFQVELEKIDKSEIKVLLEKGEMLKLLGQSSEAVKIYNRIKGLDGRLLLEEKTIACLKINEIYLNFLGSDIKKILPEIEENFENANYEEITELNEYKKDLLQKFELIKRSIK